MTPGCHLAMPACWWRYCFRPPPDPVVPCSESTDNPGRCFGLVAFAPREWSGPGPDCSLTGHSAEVVRRQWLGWFVEQTSWFFLPFWWCPSAGIGPGSLLACRAADNGRCTRRIATWVTWRCNDIPGCIGMLWRFSARDGAPRRAGVLRKRIFSVQ